MNNTVTLHCKPYVKNWLIQQFGNPVKFPRNSSEHKIFSACLDKKFKPSSDYNKKLYSARIEIAVSREDITTHGNFLSITHQHYINRFYEHQIDLELFLFVYSHEINGTGINAGVKSYQFIYGFADEIISFDALEKRYDRFKKKLKNRIFGTSVPKNNNHVTNFAQRA